MNIIILGPPASGKGTQAERISKEFSIPHISTGSILRHAIENKTGLGLKAKKYVEAGELVPDELMDELVKERLSFRDCNSGFILDGFPRDIEQARALENIRAVEYAFDITLSEDEAVKRLAQRRECPRCGKTYNLKTMPPRKKGVCDDCNTRLSRRKDDNPDAIRNRMKVYEKQAGPLRDYYNSENTLTRIDGGKNIEEVGGEIRKNLYIP
ncbi:MAG TPA: adenylate kinase [Candidatus Altiarchaeales archaeon]|nr:adenylate kinase [Candidatus Altiarchaeales archaeon]